MSDYDTGYICRFCGKDLKPAIDLLGNDAFRWHIAIHERDALTVRAEKAEAEVERLRELCREISRDAKTLCSNMPNCDFRYEHGKIWAAETILKAAGRGEG